MQILQSHHHVHHSQHHEHAHHSDTHHAHHIQHHEHGQHHSEPSHHDEDQHQCIAGVVASLKAAKTFRDVVRIVSVNFTPSVDSVQDQF